MLLRREYLLVLCVLFALLLSCLLLSGFVQARTLVDAGDGLDLSAIQEPKRVVVLEYSFLDAVVLSGISPVGIADDNKPELILPSLLQQLSDYQSVGLRGQPNLETIASLKPDLIIADKLRHSAIYDELKHIAPTLLLLSYGAEYQDLLKDADTIGQALGRSKQMQQRLQQHQSNMDNLSEQLKSSERLLFAVASERGVTVHASRAFASGVMQRLGLKVAVPAGDDRAYMKVSFEQLASMNPDWLFIGDYNVDQGGADILKRWQAHPLWPMLTIAKKKQLLLVDPSTWSLGRGVYAAEQLAQDLLTSGMLDHQTLQARSAQTLVQQ